MKIYLSDLISSLNVVLLLIHNWKVQFVIDCVIIQLLIIRTYLYIYSISNCNEQYQTGHSTMGWPYLSVLNHVIDNLFKYSLGFFGHSPYRVHPELNFGDFWFLPVIM